MFSQAKPLIFVAFTSFGNSKTQNYSFSHLGELKVFELLDREERDEYKFKVRAVDGGGRYCEADIHITVEDVSDNSPQFSSESYTITVFENTEVGTYVGKVLATDADTGEPGQ